MKLKNIIISMGFAGLLWACVEIDSEYRRKTYSGYVASDYTLIHLKHYRDMLGYIYRFNEYYSQPTLSKRDSVDKLYFNNIKILRGEDEHTWTLRRISYTSSIELLSIRTNGHPLNTPNAVWTIHDLSSSKKDTDMGVFQIKNQTDGSWIIEQHDNLNQDFESTSSWTVRFDKGKPQGTLQGHGRLLSIELPQLQLDYTIEIPLQINDASSFTAGKIKILATDVRLGLTEETRTNIVSSDRLEVEYKNYRENWWYDLKMQK